jgi:dienelactone hydrolase
MAATVTPQRVAVPPHPRRGGGRLPRASAQSPVPFFAGTSILCVHLLDDNFLEPQPGTQAGDHLVSGLVPIAILLGIAIIYPRLRAGTRAAWAITVGLFGVVMGASEAGYYSLANGPSGDDFTGLLAIPAGLALVAIGTIILWTTRRTDDHVGRRYLRRLLLALGGGAAAYFILLPVCLSYVFTHSARAGVPRAELGAAYEQVAFRTSDGLTLKGWYVPSRNGAAVIATPGRGGAQRPARVLVRHGYGVLLFDRRGEGESDGDPNAFGWRAARDIKAAVAFLQHRPDVRQGRIGGIGLSVGGETLLQAAAESDGLKAIVSDGAGSRSIREDLANPRSDKWNDIPTSLVISAATTIFSNHAPPPNLKHLVVRIAPRPVLFIYGQHDQPNVRGLTPSYYKAAREPKAIWQVPAATHTGAIDSHPREYERRVIAFFDHALLGGT